MSKGRRPTEKNRPPVLTVDSTGGGDGAEGAGGVQPGMSWTFILVDLTEFASLARVGTPIRGIVRGDDLLIRNGSYVYGFAPGEIAIEIIEVIKNNGGNPAGFVLSVGDQSRASFGVTQPEIMVRLSLA